MRSQARQLPLIIGKVIGGIMAATGLPAAIFFSAQRPGLAHDPLPYLFMGLAGLVLFVASSLLLKKNMARDNQTMTAGEKSKESRTAWLILLALAIIFLAATLIITGL